jgi:parallel beta-helix repeat protein
MIKIVRFLLGIVALVLPVLASAQAPVAPSSLGPYYTPNWYLGYTPTPQQWQFLLSNKVDANAPFSTTGNVSIGGNLTAGTSTVTNNATIGGPLGVTGAITGAGAEATNATQSLSLSARFSQVVNALDYAKGDGTTNDTAALQAALNYAASVGRPFYCPAAVYRADMLTYPSGLPGIFGNPGGGCIIKRIDSAPAGTYQISASVPVVIEDITLDGNTANNTQISTGILAATNQVAIRRVEIKNQRGTGAGGVGGNYGWGMYFLSNASLSSPTMSVIADNYVHDNGGIGIEVKGTAYNLRISGNRSLTNDTGINVASTLNNTGDVQYVDIIGNVAYGNRGGGLSLGGFNDYVTYPVQHVTVSGNVFSHNGSYGLNMQCDQCTATGNVVDYNSLVTGLGGVLGNSSYVTFAGNSVTNNNGWGMDAGSAQHLTVTGNTFRNNTFTSYPGSGTALNLNGNDGSTVTGNLFDSNTSTAGSEISLASWDGGGIWPVINSYGRKTVIADNHFIMQTGAAFPIFTSGAVANITIKNNAFDVADGATYVGNMQLGGVSLNVQGNVVNWTPPVYVGDPNTVIPDSLDTIVLPTVGATNISKFLGYTQSSALGQITYINPGTVGSCTVAPTVTITNTGGTNGAATALLGNTTVASGVLGYLITNPGSGITSATASVSGGTCSTMPTPGAVNIGYPTAMDGRTITLINESGNTQTLVNGTWIKLAGGANAAMTNHSTMTFRIANGGVWYETSRALQ